VAADAAAEMAGHWVHDEQSDVAHPDLVLQALPFHRQPEPPESDPVEPGAGGFQARPGHQPVAVFGCGVEDVQAAGGVLGDRFVLRHVRGDSRGEQAFALVGAAGDDCDHGAREAPTP
jgi:hypothetical protein